ncbi:MAG: SpoIID/LytB domain-containing protein [Candidatus Eiseniibacteriota bacterium]
MRRLAAAVAALWLAGCAGGPPIHTSPPSPAPSRPEPAPPPPVPATPPLRDDERGEPPFAGDLLVRIGLHWERGKVDVSSRSGLVVEDREGAKVAAGAGAKLVISAGDEPSVLVADRSRRVLREGAALRVTPAKDGDLVVGSRRVRGVLELSSRADSLFVVNVLPIEEYLRGVVPREIGGRPEAEREAVAAQAVAARTYTVKRLGQYRSLPFDLYASVQDQVYEGMGGEDPVADLAIRETAGLVLTDRGGPIEAYYSSTCGGHRSDIAAVWPHRQVFASLRGGPDGADGRSWCSFSPHFAWSETWDGATLSRLVRENVPAQLEIPPGLVRGDLVDVRVARRDPSGRAAEIEYVTTSGSWSVPGDRNRWVLRRADGSILRSVLVELEVERRGERVHRVTVTGRGNGHGVGMCQMGAIGRARAGASFREILAAYYPGAETRRIRREDIPEGWPETS